MFRNFIVVAFRSFLKHRFYSLINVFGLSAGLACTLFIFLWVKDERGMNAFHADGDKMYRVVSNIDFGDGETLTWEITPGPLADEVRREVPGVDYAVRTMDNGAHLFQAGERSFYGKRIVCRRRFLSHVQLPDSVRQ